MSKKSKVNRKNNSPGLPVHKKSKRKKNKKPSLTKTIKTVDQNKVPEPVPRKPRAKAERKLLKHRKRVSKREVESSARSKRAFGAVSSDSDPEPINANWDLSEDEAEKLHGASWDDDTSKYRASDPASKIADANDMSSDLDESESDLDEEVTDTQLNALLSNKADREGVVDTEDDDESDDTSTDLSPSVTETTVILPKIVIPDALSTNSADQSKTINNTITRADCLNTETHTVFSWNNERELLTEIEKRSVDLSLRSLYVAPVPPNCNLDKLKQLSPTLISCRLSYNPHTKVCRQYAFLEYPDAESAMTARKSIMGRLFGGRAITAQPVRPQFIASQGWDIVNRTQLFVSGLHQTVTRADLHQAFPKAQEVDYPFHAGGHPIGYAVVKFVNPDVTLEAFGQVHRRTIRGQPVFVNFVISQNKRELNQQKKAEQSKHSLKSPANGLQSSPPAIPSKKVEACNPTSADDPRSTASTTSHLTMPTISCTKTSKVLIQPIIETETDTQPDPFEKWSAEALFIRPCDKSMPKNLNVLAKLVRAQKRKRYSSPESSGNEGSLEENQTKTEDEMAGEQAVDDENDEENDDVEGDDSSNSFASENSSDEESAYATDSDGDDNKEVENESVSSSGMPSSDKPITGKLDEVGKPDDSSDDDINNMLGAVMRARRRATRALKTAGSSKRNWAAGTIGRQKGKKQQSDEFRKKPKPFMLPVPEKRMKL
ncbi:nucleolin [Paragonimus heterotremus]|uniref:Nucleolin n=1 Tax=Paragonimus heterotremus TaxID=100268 RepID=A0A8J4TLA2_9TREM|nr:nucleolin [Paragonimus heterotremus]